MVLIREHINQYLFMFAIFSLLIICPIIACIEPIGSQANQKCNSKSYINDTIISQLIMFQCGQCCLVEIDDISENIDLIIYSKENIWKEDDVDIDSFYTCFDTTRYEIRTNDSSLFIIEGYERFTINYYDSIICRKKISRLEYHILEEKYCSDKISSSISNLIIQEEFDISTDSVQLGKVTTMKCKIDIPILNLDSIKCSFFYNNINDLLKIGITYYNDTILVHQNLEKRISTYEFSEFLVDSYVFNNGSKLFLIITSGVETESAYSFLIPIPEKKLFK